MQVHPQLQSATTPVRDRDSHARSENTDNDSSKMDQPSWLSGHWLVAIVDYLPISRGTCTACRSPGTSSSDRPWICRSPGSSYRATGRSNWRRTFSTRVAVDFLNARRKPANGPRPRVCWKLSAVGPHFGKWQVIFAKLLEMSCFSPFHLLSRVIKFQQITKKKYQIIEDAFRREAWNDHVECMCKGQKK